MILIVLVACIGIIPIILSLGMLRIHGKSTHTYLVFMHMIAVGIWQLDIVILNLADYIASEQVVLFLFKLFRVGTICVFPFLIHLTYLLLKEPSSKKINFLNRILKAVFNKWTVIFVYVWTIFVYITSWSPYGVTGFTTMHYTDLNLSYYYPTFGFLNQIFRIHFLFYFPAIPILLAAAYFLQNKTIKRFISEFAWSSLIIYSVGMFNIFPETNLLYSSISVLVYSIFVSMFFIKMYVTLLKNYQNVQDKQNRMHHVGTMTSSLIHEIKNLITIIKGYTELLPKVEKMSEKGLSLNEHVLTASVQLNNLVTSFSEFVKSKSMNLTFKRFNVSELLNKSLKMAQERLDKSNVRLKTSIEKEDFELEIDISHMTQVMLNLIVNSIEAMEHSVKKEIVISSFIDEENNVVFRVTDTGEGIPSDQRKTIFNVFHTTKETGTGIGLAYCHNIVLLHSGTIEVVEHKEVGTTFEIKFPQYNVSKLIVEGM